MSRRLDFALLIEAIMFRILPLFCRLLLALALTLGSAGAIPISNGGNLTPMVICGENGPQTIWLDVSGTPAEPEHNCYKCNICIIFNGICTINLGFQACPVFPRLTKMFLPSVRSAAPVRAEMHHAPRGPPTELLGDVASKASSRQPLRIAPDILELYQFVSVLPGPCLGRTAKDAPL